MEQRETLASWMTKKKQSQRQFLDWLEIKGILISPQYLCDVLKGKRSPGPRFKKVFLEITGVSLVDGLIEEKP